MECQTLVLDELRICLLDTELLLYWVKVFYLMCMGTAVLDAQRARSGKLLVKQEFLVRFFTFRQAQFIDNISRFLAYNYSMH